MTKIKIYSVTLLLGIVSLVSCNKSEIPFFSDKDGVNFYSTNEDNPTSDEEFEYEVKFNYVFTDEIELHAPIFIQGRASEADRNISFIITDSTAVAPEMSIEKVVIKAGETEGVVRIKIKRPANNTDELISYVTIDPDNSDFKAGTEERQQIIVNVTDMNNYEDFNMSDWMWEENSLDYYIGAFSFGKVRFICNILKLDDFESWARKNSDDFNEDVYREVKVKFEEYKNTPGSKPYYDETKYPEKVWIDFSSDFDYN